MVSNTLNDKSSVNNQNSLKAFNLFNKEGPQIYVACLSSYTNGILHGAWIDATQEVEIILGQINQLLANSPISGAEEFAIHDYQGFYSLRVEEYDGIEYANEKALFVLEHGALGAEVAAYYGGDLEDAEEALKTCYQGAYKSELEYATYLFDERYLSFIPESVQFYVDYEKFQRDIFINNYFSLEVEGNSHIFALH